MLSFKMFDFSLKIFILKFEYKWLFMLKGESPLVSLELKVPKKLGEKTWRDVSLWKKIRFLWGYRAWRQAETVDRGATSGQRWSLWGKKSIHLYLYSTWQNQNYLEVLYRNPGPNFHWQRKKPLKKPSAGLGSYGVGVGGGPTCWLAGQSSG